MGSWFCRRDSFPRKAGFVEKRNRKIKEELLLASLPGEATEGDTAQLKIERLLLASLPGVATKGEEELKGYASPLGIERLCSQNLRF